MIQVDFMPHAINENLRDLARMQTFVDFAYIRPLISEVIEVFLNSFNKKTVNALTPVFEEL